MFLKLLKKTLGMEKLHPDIQFFLDCSNLRISRAVSIIMMLVEAFVFAISFFFQVNQEVENPAHWIFIHRVLYVVLFLASMQLCIYSFTHQPEKDKFTHHGFNASLGLFLLVTFIFAIYIAYNDYILNEQILVFITLELFIGSLYMIKPLISIPTIVISFGVFYFLMKTSVGVSAATKINYPILMVVFLAGNIVHFQQYLRIAKRNIISHKLAEELRIASLYDPLTTLKNRNALRIDFSKLLESNITLMLTDIDDFKSYNDTYGHNFGDDLLIKFAKILQDSFGKEHCYRYGGDEYLIMVPEISEEDFCKMIDNCMTTINGEFHFSGGYSAGLVTTQADLHSFINKADENLYKSKGSGKNKVIGS
ncbi:MAG: GGDEF domain-containing protein [Treponema sp.]|nr:GGDEF domain-containing protein [Treponema sp.]